MRLKGVLVLGVLGLVAACSEGSLDTSARGAVDAGGTSGDDQGDGQSGAAPIAAGVAGRGAEGAIDPDAGTATCGCPAPQGPQSFGVQWSDIDCFCSVFGCPDLASREVPIDSCAAQRSENGWGPLLTSGCGLIQYERGSYSGGVAYQFEARTGVIVAAQSYSDIPFPTPDQSCSAPEYIGGTFTDLTACPDFSSCLACKTLTPAPADVPACPAP